MSSEFFDVLSRHSVGYVFLEGYFMPHIGEVFGEFQPATAEFAVIRLHGSDRSDIEKRTGKVWNQVVDPKPNGLTAAAEIIRANAAQKIRTFVNVNNHFEGSAPLTIERLVAELERDGCPPGRSKKWSTCRRGNTPGNDSWPS
ncbi:MAG: DUF72 domain-containing protein [Lentisphaerae bacterium]|nr:DUF72 domain-containing protein [Lentisphaerota bacterium]